MVIPVLGRQRLEVWAQGQPRLHREERIRKESTEKLHGTNQIQKTKL
jgi:hypothetical protein